MSSSTTLSAIQIAILSKDSRDEIQESILLQATWDANDHIFLTNDTRVNPAYPRELSFDGIDGIDGIRRRAHIWLYMCKHPLSCLAELTLRQSCGHETCINPDHWYNAKDTDEDIFKIGAKYLDDNSTPNGDCRLWTKGIDKDGYGRAHFNGKDMHAHTVAMLVALKVLKLPNKQRVFRTCGRPSCIAIAHLYLGTHQVTQLKGSQLPQAVLDEATALAIYQSKNDGLTQQERADKTGVSRSTVRGVDIGQNWSQATGAPKLQRNDKVTTLDSTTPEAVFLELQELIRRNSLPVPDQETEEVHWIWQAGKNPQGYGKYTFRGKTMGAHQASWIAFNKKPIPPGFKVLHTCKLSKECVCPEHLYVGRGIKLRKAPAASTTPVTKPALKPKKRL